MTVNSHLTQISSAAIIRDSEKEKVQKSVEGIKKFLNSHFGSTLEKIEIFGSYSRRTILPRRADENSDVDLLIVFSDTSFTPQTYLTRLKKFAEKQYSKSEIFQSNPTVVLQLNHIKFDLVPAINRSWEGLKIPAKKSDYNDWIPTNPTGFNQQLVTKNKENDNCIKPLIRIMKYWNARKGHPFDSYELEQMIVGFSYSSIFTSSMQLKDYWYKCVESFSTWSMTNRQSSAIKELKNKVARIKSNENSKSSEAESELKGYLPIP